MGLLTILKNMKQKLQVIILGFDNNDPERESNQPDTLRRRKLLALPVEVICHCILPYLSTCVLQAFDTAFTNKYLRPQLRQVWKSYQYNSLDVELKEFELFWLCKKGVRIISFTVENNVSESSFSRIRTTTVKRLRVTSEFVSSTILKFAANCTNLEELYLDGVYGQDTDNAVSALAQNCRQLHTLHIGSDYLTDAGILALAECCGQLNNISLCHARVTDAGIQSLCDNCPHLKHIGLLKCNNLTDASLIAIANTYQHLRSILIESKNFTDDGIIYVADKCHELRSVSVRCDNITSRGLTALWAANPNLMDVDIKYNRFISDDDIIQLVQCCSLLQKLNMHCCMGITDAAVIAVAEHCPQLRSLDISIDISDASLIALGQNCHELKSIDISYIQKISEVGIAALAAGCPLLQEFYAGWSSITDAGVVALARGCRDLRIIDMYWCKYIGIAAVSAIAENCPLLSTLNVSNCTKVDDACLYVIAQHCRNLTFLDVTSTKVSDADAVISVIKSCRMLRQIECFFCFKDEKDEQLIRQHGRG